MHLERRMELPLKKNYEHLYDKFRSNKTRRHDPIIGCTILMNPFFFKKEEWIPAPSDWASNIVQGKTYETNNEIGKTLWMEVCTRLNRLNAQDYPLAIDHSEKSFFAADPENLYGTEYLTKARLGQGAFRVLVTDAYSRRCAVTGERTLPALEAAHIKPFSKTGPNLTSNGLLLRSDLHKLFDQGYISVTPALYVEVSRKIKEEFENGRDYYAFHGEKLAVFPSIPNERPASHFLEWHNNNVYLG